MACENITQAVANDLLRYALRECDKTNLNVILHCHDEIVLECDSDTAEKTTEKLDSIMCSTPEWAVGIPLNIEASVMKRYGK